MEKYLTLSIKGNYTNIDGSFYPTEVLYKAWKSYIGKEIECPDEGKRIVTDVDMQGDFILVDTVLL